MNALSDIATSETSAPIDSDTNASPDPNPSKPAPTTLDAFGLAQAIASQLKGTTPWTAKPVAASEGTIARDIASIVRSSDGASVDVHVGGYQQKGRVSFCAGWPHYATGERYQPRKYLSITCAESRTPAALAREIERRLLAEFEPLFAAALEYVRKCDNAAAAAHSAAIRIARAVGGNVPTPNDWRAPRRSSAVEVFSGPPGVHKLQVIQGWEGAPRVTFEVGAIDEATALRLLAILAEPSREPSTP